MSTINCVRDNQSNPVMIKPLLFALNGQRVELWNPVDPSTTLLTFIRTNTRFTGTKLGCGDGGCGACIVLLSKYDRETQSVEHHSINSCITPLYSIHGCSITTIEGLGSTQVGFHSVQERIAGFHGSQCGFCTPGMCMSMYSCFLNSVQDNGDHHTIPSLSLANAQTAIVGNICRCTGYRPIIDACKSFANDVDIEDLGMNTFWDSSKDANINLLPPFTRSPLHKDFPQFLLEELESSQKTIENHCSKPAFFVSYEEAGQELVWVQVRTLQSAFATLKKYHGYKGVKLVVGNTSSGYYKDEHSSVYIDIGHIPELLGIQKQSNAVIVGASVTIEKLIHALEAKKVIDQDSITYGLISHLMKVANPHVRHRASVGGNIIMAQQQLFGSDLATLFLAIGASLQVVDQDGHNFMIDIEEFLAKKSIEPLMILESITLPLENCGDTQTINENSNVTYKHTTKQIFKSYRAAPRRLGNALAFMNAAFLATLSTPSSEHPYFNILDVKLAFGAFGHAQAIRAHTIEDFLLGKSITQDVLSEAIKMLKNLLGPPLKVAQKPRYKMNVAIGFFFDFFNIFLTQQHKSFAHKTIASSNDSYHLKSHANDIVGDLAQESKIWKSIEDFHVLGRQKVPTYEEDQYIGKSILKSEAKIQATGEATYVDDIPSPKNCLFAAFVISEKAHAKIKFVDPSQALACPGVVTFISAKDIPQGGANLGAPSFGGIETEILFATEMVEYVGQPLGVVVADSTTHAKFATEKVHIEYEVDTPILSIEDAIVRNSFFTSSQTYKTSIEDIERGFIEAEHKVMDVEVRMGSQYFFYMETQTALAVPDEDNCITVYNSSQAPDMVQKSISNCLAIPIHNVRVITRRVGGGFGGKGLRNITVALACAIAAHKLRHPVRMYLDRRTDMIMMGGRHPMKALYSVGFKSNGKITGLKTHFWIDGGFSEDCTPIMPMGVIQGMMKYNWGSMDVDYTLCRTNLPSKTSMRAPGHLQGSFVADTIIEHVASVLGVEADIVITKNMHTIDSLKLFYPHHNVGGSKEYTLPSLWDEMLKRMEEKRQNILSFNEKNSWCKRGLSILPCIYAVSQMHQPARVSIFHDGSIVVEVGGIEIGQGLYTKVKQATILGLSSLLPMGEDLSKSIKVRVVQADTISLPNGGMTGGSTSSASSCLAIKKASQILVERIMPLKVKKENELSDKVSWNDLINLAIASNINLSAQEHFFPNGEDSNYLNYGVAASEVELNVLTGAITIIQTDIIYDAGRSLNPAIDIGQVEGAFVQGIGFFLTEEIEVDDHGVLLSKDTWTYKPPTLDNIPQKFNVELASGLPHRNRVLSSKACGEPPLVLAGTVHSAVRHAITSARRDLLGHSKSSNIFFQMDTPATMDKIQSLCGLDVVEESIKCHGIKMVSESSYE